MAMAKHMNIADFENELLFCRQQTLHNTACTQSNTQIRKVNLTNLQLQSYMDRHSIKIKFEVWGSEKKLSKIYEIYLSRISPFSSREFHFHKHHRFISNNAVIFSFGGWLDSSLIFLLRQSNWVGPRQNWRVIEKTVEHFLWDNAQPQPCLERILLSTTTWLQ